jgi:type IV secretory pathway TrbF-like protein
MRADAEHDLQHAAHLRDNELESAKRTAQKLWVAVWGLGALLTVAVIANAVQGVQHRWVIRYVEVDKASNQQRVIEPAAERYEPAQSVVEGTLEDAITALRRVSKDNQLMDDDWDKLKVCMTPAGRKRLLEYQTKDDPRKQVYPRSVQIISRLRKTARTYDFRWQEWQYDQSDNLKGTAMYSASITFERRDPRTEQELHACRAGIFVDTWTLGKDQ